MNGGTGTCENGTKYCIRWSSSPVGTRDRWRMSCATPTTSRQGTAADGVGGPVAVSGSKFGSKPMRMHLPSALSPGHADRAMVSFTTTTGAPCSSAAVSLRPWRILMPRMSKNSGVAACRNGSWDGNGRHVEPRERYRGNGRRGANARHRADPLEGRIEEIAPRRPTGSLLDVDHHDVVHVHPKVLRKQSVKTPAEHARVGEQQHAQGRLDDEQGRLEGRAPPAESIASGQAAARRLC